MAGHSSENEIFWIHLSEPGLLFSQNSLPNTDLLGSSLKKRAYELELTDYELRLWTRMLSIEETQRDQVSQTRNRKGLYTTPLPATPCSQASIWPSMFQLQQTLPSAVWSPGKFVITSEDCFSVLSYMSCRLLAAYCISHPSSFPALLSLPKLLSWSWTWLLPDSSHLLRDAGTLFSKTSSTTVNRSTNQTNSVYHRSAKLLLMNPLHCNKMGCELAKAHPIIMADTCHRECAQYAQARTTYSNRHQTQNQQDSQLSKVPTQSTYLQ